MSKAEEFSQILKVAREHRVSSFSMNELGLNVTFEGSSLGEPAMTKGSESKIPVEGMPTEDQMLFWSTDNMPDQKEVK